MCWLKARTGTSHSRSKLFLRSQFAARFLWRQWVDNWDLFCLFFSPSSLRFGLMALNLQWIEARKKWICLTQIFGLCSQTLLCLIWGVGTGFGEHKGKKLGGPFSLEREWMLWLRRLPGCLGPLSNWGFVDWVTVWKVYTLLGGPGSGVASSVVFLGHADECAFRSSSEMWRVRPRVVSGGERREGGGDTFSLSLIWSFIRFIHSGGGASVTLCRAFQMLPSMKYLTFIRCKCTIQR